MDYWLRPQSILNSTPASFHSCYNGVVVNLVLIYGIVRWANYIPLSPSRVTCVCPWVRPPRPSNEEVRQDRGAVPRAESTAVWAHGSGIIWYTETSALTITCHWWNISFERCHGERAWKRMQLTRLTTAQWYHKHRRRLIFCPKHTMEVRPCSWVGLALSGGGGEWQISTYFLETFEMGIPSRFSYLRNVSNVLLLSTAIPGLSG